MLATARVPSRASTRASQHPYTITEFARARDICACAMPLYEDLDLLPQQRVGRNRIDTQRNRTRLKLTLQGKRPSLGLLEVKQPVDIYDLRRRPRSGSPLSWAYRAHTGRCLRSSAKTSKSRWPRLPSTKSAAAACHCGVARHAALKKTDGFAVVAGRKPQQCQTALRGFATTPQGQRRGFICCAARNTTLEAAPARKRPTPRRLAP